MSGKIVKKKRIRSYKIQNGLCHYCNGPMFEPALEEPKDFYLRLGRDKPFTINYHNQYVKKNLICSLEHKNRREDGGGNLNYNTIACHAMCNTNRRGLCYWQHKKNKGRRVDVFKEYGWCRKIPNSGRSIRQANIVDISMYDKLFKDLLD